MKMQTGTIIGYRDDGERPRAEVVLLDGDRLFLTLGRDGLAISRSDGSVVFRAGSQVVSRLCAGLVDSRCAPSATPLQILLAAVVQLRSADAVRAAFEDAAAQAAS
jgi:hypothetical protein